MSNKRPSGKPIRSFFEKLFFNSRPPDNHRNQSIQPRLSTKKNENSL